MNLHALPLWRAGWLSVAAVLLTSVAAMAQSAGENLELPQDPRQWIGFPPLSISQLKGKAVLLLFFEETCPKCMAKWSEYNELAKSHADDPILFLAVSSETQRNQMEAYIRKNQVAWPVLLDPDRSFEKACEIDKISLENITQVAAISADGSLQHGNWGKPEALAEKVLADAKWTIDPTTIPTTLRPTWQQVEFQNYPGAAAALRKALKSNKEDIKSAAEELLAAVQPAIDEQVKAAESAYDAGEKWTAFHAYSQLAERFKGYELPENVDSRKKELQSDPVVKAEAVAMKAFDNAQRQVNNPAQQKKGLALLKRLVKDKPDTAAGKKAQALLTELGAE